MTATLHSVRGPRVAPLATVETTRQRTPRSAERVSCGVCGKTFAGGCIITGELLWDRDELCMVSLRQVYCDHCNHVMSWTEQMTAEGKPRGTVVTGPGYVRSRRAVEDFLRRHPEARGVEL